jgi:hypothetical protein
MLPNQLLAAGYRMSAHLFRRMTSDLTPEEFLHQPLPGTNCAAWLVGHLALTMLRSLKRLGMTDLPTFPEELVPKFQVTGQPAGEQSDFGDPKQLLAIFDACVEAMIRAIRTLPPDLLTQTIEGPPPFAATRGEAIAFGSHHITLHCGQLSTIRRSLGKPPGA